MDEHNLKRMVNTPVFVCLSARHLGKVVLRKCILCGVEQNGLWLEDEQLSNFALAALKVKTDQRTRAVFVPFQVIEFLFGHFDAPPVGKPAVD